MRKFLLSFVAMMLAFTANAQSNEVTIDFSDPTAFGYQAAGKGEFTQIPNGGSITSGDVSIDFAFESGTGARFFAHTTTGAINLRIYVGTTFEVSANGANITSIKLEGSNLSDTYITCDGFNGTEWTGSETSVTFVCKKSTVQINKMTITYGGEVAAVKDVKFSVPAGTYYTTQNVALSCATEGATIYYQTTGDWGDAVVYTEPIVVDKSMTIYAQATKGADKSNETSAAYVIETTKTAANIDEVYSMTANDVFTYTTDATVVFAKGNNTIITDGTRYLLIYGSTGQTYKAGDIIPAGFGGKYSIYNNVGQIVTPFTGFTASKGTGTLPTYQTVNTQSTILTSCDQDNRYLTPVEFKGVSIAISNKNVTITDAEGNFAGFNQYGLTLPTETEGKTFDVKGFASMYKTNYQVYIESITEANNTGISQISTSAASAQMYNAMGQRVSKASGLVIMNGKKFFVK